MPTKVRYKHPRTCPACGENITLLKKAKRWCIACFTPNCRYNRRAIVSAPTQAAAWELWINRGK